MSQPWLSPSIWRALSKPLYALDRASAAFNVFVDSTRPDDTGDGLTLLTAKKTLSAAAPLVTAGKKLGLARGSVWREQFNPANNMTIGVVGTGAMPVIDAADVVTDTWVRTDPGTFPNRWTISWTRAEAASGSDDLGLWADGVRPRRAVSFQDLADNGGWMAMDYRALTTDVHINSVADPNTSGVLYEITRRRSGIHWHPQLGGSDASVSVVGPIEIKRAVGHYNAVSAGPGSVKNVLMRDGHIHHTVLGAALAQDCVAFEARPGAEGIPFTSYRADGTGFNPVIERCHSLFAGGANRELDASFYAHSSTGSSLVDSFTVKACTSRGRDGVLAGAVVMAVEDTYIEDQYAFGIDLTAATSSVLRAYIHQTATSPLGGGALGIRRSNASTNVHTVTDSVILSAGAVGVSGDPAGRTTYQNCAIRAGSNGVNGGLFTLNKCIIQADARAMSGMDAGYAGDYNVFFPFPGQGEPWFHHNVNGLTTYDSLVNWRSWTGADTNSVWLAEADQTSGNPLAFWLGVANGTGGPEVGDWRINPNCRVYGDGGDLPNASYTGTFVDGTPITQAGPQNHYNHDTREVVAGPPTRRPTLPTTLAGMRDLAEGNWTFYP